MSDQERAIATRFFTALEDVERGFRNEAAIALLGSLDARGVAYNEAANRIAGLIRYAKEALGS